MARRLIDGDRRREQQRQALILDRLEKRFAPAFAREIARASRVMADGFAETGAVPTVPDHQRNINEIMQGLASASIRVFSRRVLDAQRADCMVIERKDFADTVARLALRYIMLEGFRRKIVNISDTTRNQIIAQVQRGFDAGMGQEGVARFIADNVAGIARTRARVIARTETHGAANYGAYGAAEETGLVLRKEWIAAEDERTRDDHADMDGTVIGKDDLFDFGGYSLAYPGDPSGPAEGIINCRCALGWVVDD